MISVKYNAEGYRLSVEGHSGYAEPGKDIICSAASILAYTLAQNLMFAKEDGYIQDLQANLEQGNAEISCKPVAGREEEVQCIFSVVRTGFLLLGTNYPKFINFSEVG